MFALVTVNGERKIHRVVFSFARGRGCDFSRLRGEPDFLIPYRSIDGMRAEIEPHRVASLKAIGARIDDLDANRANAVVGVGADE